MLHANSQATGPSLGGAALYRAGDTQASSTQNYPIQCSLLSIRPPALWNPPWSLIDLYAATMKSLLSFLLSFSICFQISFEQYQSLSLKSKYLRSNTFESALYIVRSILVNWLYLYLVPMRKLGQGTQIVPIEPRFALEAGDHSDLHHQAVRSVRVQTHRTVWKPVILPLRFC